MCQWFDSREHFNSLDLEGGVWEEKSSKFFYQIVNKSKNLYS